MESNLSIDYIPEALEGTAVLHLTGSATFVEAPSLRKELFGALGSLDGGRLVVELANVERMDTAAMAVLVEGLLETRNGPGPQIYFCTPSDSVKNVFHLAGLDEALKRCYGCLGDLPEHEEEDCGCDG